MPSNWRSRSNEQQLEALNDKIEELRNVSYNFSEIVNQKGDISGIKGKGSGTGAFGATSGNQIFNPTRTVISKFDELGVDQTVFDRLNISSRYMIVETADPLDINIKWIQLATANGQKISIQGEVGKTMHLIPGGNVDIGAQVDITDNQIVELVFSEESDITADGGWIIVGLGSGGGGLNFPILYPEDDLGTVGSGNIALDLAGADAHFKQVTINGDIGLTTPINPPSATKFFEFWLQITQDVVGGRSIVTTSWTELKNASTLDALLDKTSGGVTVFHFVTGDGGVSYHGELVDFSSGSGGEFFGPMTAPHNYAGQNIDNLGTLKFDIINSEIQVDPTGMTFLTPAGDNWDWFEATVGSRMTLDTNSLDLKVDLDLNPTSLLAHTISGFDLLQLQNDAGTEFGTVTPNTGAFPGWQLTMPLDNDFIINGVSGERFRFSPDTAPSDLMIGGTIQTRTMQSGTGDVYQIVNNELSSFVQHNATNEQRFRVGGADKLFVTTTTLDLYTDIDFRTFDAFNIDSLIFMSTAGTLGSLDVGFSSLGSGGFRANVLNNGVFKIEEENVDKFVFDTNLNVAQFRDMSLQLHETIGGTTSTISKFSGRTEIQETTKIEFTIGANLQFDITDGQILFSGAKGIIANIDQLGFRNLGNIIQDDINGMIFNTPVGDDFTFSDGTDIFMTVDKDLFALQFASMQIPKIAVPPDPGISTAGKIFYNTTSNRLNFRRRNDADTAFETIDLEGGGGGTSFADDVFDIHDNVTPTKILQFQLANLIAGTSFITTEPITVSPKTWTLPDIDGTFIMNAGVQTITGVKTFEAGTLQVEEAIGTSVGIFEVDPLTVNRTYTFPNLSGDVPLLNQVQTWTGQNTFNAKVTIGNIVDLVPAVDLGSSIGDSTHAFSRGYFDRVVFDVTTKFIDSVGSLDLVFEVPSLGNMFFRENGVNFWELDGDNNICKFYRDIELTAGEAIRANAATEIGYFTTNTTVSVGTAGSMQMPVVASLTPTVASLDAAFGSAIGCFGMYNTSNAFVNLAIKNLAGEWVLLAFPDAGGTVTSDHIQ